MNAEKRKCYERPVTNVIKAELTQMIATSGDVTVGGWAMVETSEVVKRKKVLLAVVNGATYGITTNKRRYV